MFDQLTNDQMDALMGYADLHGQLWKSKLLSDWTNGRCNQAEIQQIRNAFGPSWLRNVKLSALVAAYEQRFGK
jgi:hypothetical protein